MHVFSINELPRTAWRNGGGSTREIMCWPPGSDLASFDWRVSVATISASGPFSRFEGIDRVIMLLEGDGVILRGPRTDWRLDQPGQPFAFSGDEELGSVLLAGTSTDFNVMTRRSVARASVQIVDCSRPVAKQAGGLAMCLSGLWRVDQRAIATGQGCWWPGGGEQLSINKGSSGVAKLVLVSWIRL